MQLSSLFRFVLRRLANQNGGALVLVLVIVLIMTTAGALLLTTTTYSQKNLEMNKQEQEEFYLAEGALDVVIEEMQAYDGGDEPLLYVDDTPVLDEHGQPIRVRRTGAYIYLEDNQRPSTITIDGKEIQVELFATKDGNKYDVLLTAKNLVSSSIKRQLALKVTGNPLEKLPLPAEDPGEGGANLTEKPFYYVGNFNNKLKSNQDKLNLDDHRQKLANSTYNQILNYFGYQPPIQYHGSRNVYDSYNFTNDSHIAQQISLSGNKKTVNIPSGAKVFSQAVNLSGNNTIQLNIEGILITESLNVSGNGKVKVDGLLIVTNQISLTGNGTLTVNSGFITNHFVANGNMETNGAAAGINCALLGYTLCGGSGAGDVPINPDDYPWTSNFIIDYYQTIR